MTIFACSVSLLIQVYVVGPNFKGVKMVPPGAHFVSSNAVSSNSSATTGAGSDVAPTVSFFVDVALRQVVIRRWDRLEELLLQLDDSDEVIHRSSQMCLVWAKCSVPTQAVQGMPGICYSRAVHVRCALSSVHLQAADQGL